MEIRTLDEIRGTRVTVTVDVALSPTEEPGALRPLYQAAVDAERELTAAQRQVAELERELARRTEERDEREAARAKLERQVADYDRDRHTERDRADKAVRKISEARELLTADEVVQARGMDCSRLGATMANAIGAALRVLDRS